MLTLNITMIIVRRTRYGPGLCSTEEENNGLTTEFRTVVADSINKKVILRKLSFLILPDIMFEFPGMVNSTYLIVFLNCGV